MTTFGRILPALFLILMLGCEEAHQPMMYDALDEEPTQQPEQAKAVSDEEQQQVERKLIKTGRIEFETDDIAETRNIIFASLDQHEGYISSDEENSYGGRRRNTIVVRVPADHFDVLLRDITAGVTKFDQKVIETKDVTEEFLDVEARLRTKKELEKRYLALLNRANSVSEILEVERELGTLRSEIESTEGRFRYLQSRVSFSTLSISIYQPIPDESEFGQSLSEGFQHGWDSLATFFFFLLSIWPFLIMGTAAFFGIRMWRKRR